MSSLRELTIDQRTRIGRIAGRAAILSSVVFIGAAFVFSPDYNPFTETISKLGIKTKGAPFFIFGIVLSAAFLFVYMEFFIKNMFSSSKSSRKGCYAGKVGALGLAGVGLIPDRQEIFFQAGHFIFAGIFFFFTGISIFFLSLHLRAEVSSSSQRLIAYSGFLVCIVAIIHLFASFHKDSTTFFGITMNLAAIWQKVAVAGYIGWFIALEIALRRISSSNDLHADPEN